MSELTFFILVNDEGESLLRCLQSLKNLPAKIILAVTGTSEALPDLRQFEAEKVYLPWEEDFSQARNRVLDLVATPWVGYLDADEALAPGSAARIAALLEAGRADAYYCSIKNLLPDQVLWHRGLRLWRHRPEHRFQGIIHEQIAPAIKGAGGSIQEGGFEIWHYGYLDAARQKDKARRNLKLCQKALLEEPGNTFMAYNLGLTYAQLKQTARAKNLLRAVTEKAAGEAEFLPSLYRTLVICCQETGEHTEAIQVADQGLTLFPWYAELYYLKALSLKECGRPWEAWEVLGRMPAKIKPGYPLSDGIPGHRTDALQAFCLRALGNWPRAAEAAFRALAAVPGNSEYLNLTLQCLKGVRSAADLPPVPPEVDPQDLETLGNNLLAGGFPEQALYLSNSCARLDSAKFKARVLKELAHQVLDDGVKRFGSLEGLERLNQ